MTKASPQPAEPQAGPGGEHTETAVLPETTAGLAELEQLKELLGAAEERGRNHWEQYLRAVAELDNVRKRAQRDVENASRYGLEKFAQEMLPVKESLDLAVENAGRVDAQGLIAGQQATQQLLAKAFERLGITEVNPLGRPFDPAEHEAVLVQESTTAEPDSVIQVVQRGYRLNGRLLRPARVIVAKPPS
jgi:molecular chaperone GrpE